jgi:hypothetical protein
MKTECSNKIKHQILNHVIILEEATTARVGIPKIMDREKKKN